MPRALTLALCGALVSLPCASAAETGFGERLRLQGGYTNLTRLAPTNDAWLGAIPELSYFVFEPRLSLRLSYSFGFTMHTALPAEIANRLELASAYDLSPRTTALFTAGVSQSSVAQAFINSPAAETFFGAVPSTRTQLAAVSVSEATSWEASPVVRVGQQVDGRFVTPIDETVRLQNSIVGVQADVDRAFRRDAIGGVVRGAYAYGSVPGARDQQILSASLAPRWRHDFGRALTSSLAAGASLVASPDPGTRALVRPFGQASLLLSVDESTFELFYAAGPQANAVTAQLFDAQQVTMRTATPLSNRYAVYVGASAGYLHGKLISLARDVVAPPALDVILADAEIGWSPSQSMQVFARYQFFDQLDGAAVTAGGLSSFMRNAVIVGIQLSSVEPGQVTRRFPQRVDRSDAPAPSRAR